MGAWGHQVMCNDTVLDTMIEIEHKKDIKKEIRNILENADGIFELLFAIEVVDISLNGLDKDILGGLYNYDLWFKEVETIDFTDLKEVAVRKLEWLKENDLGWVKSCEKDRKELLEKIEKRLRSSS